jgi:hypothetical protein
MVVVNWEDANIIACRIEGCLHCQSAPGERSDCDSQAVAWLRLGMASRLLSQAGQVHGGGSRADIA